MRRLYYDAKERLIYEESPERLTSQQKANWKLVEALMDHAYEDGFYRGLEAAKMEMKREFHLTLMDKYGIIEETSEGGASGGASR